MRMKAPPGVSGGLSEPLDVTLSGQSGLTLLGKPKSVAPPDPPPKPKRSLLQKLVRLAAWTGIAAGVGVSSLGTLGYMGNPALTEPPSLTILADQSLASAESPSKSQAQKPAVARSTGPVTVASDGVAVLVPPDTLRQVASQVQRTPLAQRFLAQKAAQAEQNLNQVLKSLKVPDGNVLLDATLPLPTGERAFFHVGNVDLPSLGVNAFQTETVPLLVGYQTSPIEPGLKLGLETFQAKNPARPDGLSPHGVYLGSIKVKLSSDKASLPVEGKLQLALDLDGQATREKMSLLQARLMAVPADSPRAAQLRELIGKHQARLGQAESLKGHEIGLLESAFQDQTMSFKAEIETGTRPLAEATYHVWMGADRTGDGRADIQLAAQTDFASLEGLKVHLRELKGDPGKAPDSMVARLLHERIQASFAGGVQQALPQVTEVLRDMAVARVDQELHKGAPWAAGEGNQRLAGAYERGLDFEVPGVGQSKSVHYQVGRVQVGEQGVLAEMRSGQRSSGRAEELKLPFAVNAGEMAVRLSGSELNQRLQSMDWNALLGEIKQSKGLLELSFGKDKAGRTILPHLVMDQATGKPAVAFDIQARMEGVKPVKGVTGLVSDGTGALDEGMGKLQKGMKKELGVPGEVVGTVLRAPFFLVDKIVGGAKTVVDHTAGAVVDGVTDQATRPTVHTGVVIPLDVSVQHGKLAVTPDAQHVRFSGAKGELPFDPLNLLPTRLMSNLIVNLVAEAQGPSQVGEAAAQRTVEVSLAGKGLEFSQVGVMPRGNGAPDLAVKLKAGPATADFVVRTLLGGERLPGS